MSNTCRLVAKVISLWVQYGIIHSPPINRADMEWRSPGVIIKTDNAEVVKALQNNKCRISNIDNIIKDIKRIANSFNFISCIKVSREEVKLAHDLATKKERLFPLLLVGFTYCQKKKKNQPCDLAVLHCLLV